MATEDQLQKIAEATVAFLDAKARWMQATYDAKLREEMCLREAELRVMLDLAGFELASIAGGG